MSKIVRLKDWYARYERRISTGSLLFGFVFDSLTLQRIDAWRENLWIALNLFLVAVCIILLHRRGKSQQTGTKEHFWLFNILQFGFGAILGGFFIFYFRSGTLAVSWPFLVILLAAMVANELYQKRYPRLVFQLSFFYLAVFSFAIYIIPILIHRIGSFVFILSGCVSLFIFWTFTMALDKFAAESFRKSKTPLWRAVITIFVLVNVLYFANLIPPIPLSLKEAGVYHSITRQVDGDFLFSKEERSFWQYLSLRERIRINPGDPLYAYSAIYSPASLDTVIIHEWQHQNAQGDWVTATRIPLSLSGGRQEGFRTYSEKSNLTPGLWRVNISTLQGGLLGRITFRAVY